MATVELDEVEFRRLQQLNNFSHAMLQHPDAAKLVEKAAKLVNPNIKTPRLDQEAAITAPVQDVRSELAALRKEISDRDAAVQQNQTLNALALKRDDGLRALRRAGWTDDGVKAVETLMEEKGILDPEIAAAYVEKQMPQQSVASPGTGGWNFMESIADDSDADLKKLIETRGEVDIVVDGIARKALTEIRAQNRR